MGEPEVTPAMHAVISGPTSERTGLGGFSGENMSTPSMQLRMDLEAMESKLIPESTQASDDGACNNECVIQYEGTTDAAQPVPPSPGMDRDPSVTIESSTVLLSQEILDEDTSSVIYAAPRDSVEQGAHIASEEDTAVPLCRGEIRNSVTRCAK